MITEHSLVVLNEDRAANGLHRGDVGSVVFVHNDGEAYEVEFVDGAGTTVSLVTLESDAIRSLAPGEMLHTRRRD